MGIDEAENAIFDAIEQLALRARDADSSGSALRYSLAASSLSEARAWLRHPDQAHGATSHVSGGEDAV